MRRRLGLALALAGAAWLTGCATPPSMPRPADTGGPLSGRLSLQVAAQGGAPARQFGAAFDLAGNAEQGELRLSTPLGTALAQARWQPGEVTLDQGQGLRRFDSLEALAAEVLGEPLPLGALTDWLRGRPWAGADSRPAASGFEQLGWRVDLARRDEGWIEARREATPAAPAVTLRARLAD